MATLISTNESTTNISQTSRIVRFGIGAAMILSVMEPSVGTLGNMAYLPLFAIYFIFSALTGWDPVRAMFVHEEDGAINLSKPVRVALFSSGVLMIASVFVASANPLGLFAMLPLIGIYPIFAAIIGSDPIDVIVNNGRVQADTIALETSSAQVQTLFDSQSVKQSPKHHHDKAA